MTRFSGLAALFLCFLATGSVFAADFNPVLKIGDRAPAWSNLPGVDGKQHSLLDLKDNPVVVVVFTCNSCPYAVDYEDRLIALAKRHTGAAGQAAVVAINVNRIEADSLPAMKQRAEEKGFPFPYLFDESQKIAQDFGAIYTPQFFVLNRERRIVYMGAMDDHTDASQAKVNYVELAIAAAVKGEPAAMAEVPPRGCRIRFVRERRRP